MSVPPLTIELMLVCYWSADPKTQLGDRRWNSEASRTARGWLLDYDLIDDNHRATERGRAWVDAICATPLPPEEPATVQPHRAHMAGWCDLSRQLMKP